MNNEYNFFVVEESEYVSSGLHNVLRRIDMLMNTNLRLFVEGSLLGWVEFLKKFHMPEQDEIWLKYARPLVTLHLHLEHSKKKDEKKSHDRNEIGAINFNPTIERANNTVTTCINWIVEGTNKINNLEADLVPFINIKKFSVFTLKEDNPNLVKCREEVDQLLERYSAGPIELLERY